MGATESQPIETSPVRGDTAALIEKIETSAWADLYAAAPPQWSKAVGPGGS